METLEGEEVVNHFTRIGIRRHEVVLHGVKERPRVGRVVGDLLLEVGREGVALFEEDAILGETHVTPVNALPRAGNDLFAVLEVEGSVVREFLVVLGKLLSGGCLSQSGSEGGVDIGIVGFVLFEEFVHVEEDGAGEEPIGRGGGSGFIVGPAVETGKDFELVETDGEIGPEVGTETEFEDEGDYFFVEEGLEGGFLGVDARHDFAFEGGKVVVKGGRRGADGEKWEEEEVHGRYHCDALCSSTDTNWTEICKKLTKFCTKFIRNYLFQK